MNKKNKIGASIPFDYFLNTPESKNALIMKEKISNSNSLLEHFNHCGINYIELRGVGYNASSDSIKEISEKLWGKGFKLTVHTDLPENIINENLESNFTFLKQIIKSIDQFQEELILVIHLYAWNSQKDKELLEKYINNMNLIAKFIESEKIPIKFAIELNRGGINNGPDKTYNGLIKFKNNITSDKIGLCWDFGHAYSNMQKNTIPLIPPDDFLKNVIQTHIHGVSKDDVTHCPLNKTNLPLLDYMQALIRNKYNGVYNLEINPIQLPQHNSLDIYKQNAIYINDILNNR